jgi:hypothetical protein
MMRISPHHSEDIAMLPCDFTVASQKHLSAVIVIFLSTIHHIYELKCNNPLFTTISLFLCSSCNNHSSSHCRSEKPKPGTAPGQQNTLI